MLGVLPLSQGDYKELRGGGGIGRRICLGSLRSHDHAGSNPVLRTIYLFIPAGSLYICG